MDKKTTAQIIHDHEVHGMSHRTLAKKYGFNRMLIYRMLRSNQKKQAQQAGVPSGEDQSLPDDIMRLKEELRKARLKIELQDLMIDISSKELGVDLRKKHGTRRSK